MTYIILIISILVLVLLITYWKYNAFIAFIIISIFVGLSNGMQIPAIVNAIEKGIGSILGTLLIIISFGAIQGKIIVESGAAQQITDHLMKVFGIKYLQWALLITGFIVGIPLFYGVGFVLLVPLVINLSVQQKLPAVWLGLPMICVLSALHGFLPPHPSPVILTQMLGGVIGKTLLIGAIVAVISVSVAGIFYAKFLKNITAIPMEAFVAKRKTDKELPNLFASYFACFLPILLIGLAAAIEAISPNNTQPVAKLFIAIGNPSIAMTIALLFSILVLGRNNGGSVATSMKSAEKAMAEISTILFVIAGAGAFNQVLSASGLTETLTKDLSQLQMSPILLGFLVAMLIRIATGSATIAGLTAAGIIKPLFQHIHIPSELMVLSIGAGSLMFSHVNDSGFWLFKEYFNLDIKQTFRSWTMMESLLGLTGLIVILIINALFY